MTRLETLSAGIRRVAAGKDLRHMPAEELIGTMASNKLLYPEEVDQFLHDFRGTAQDILEHAERMDTLPLGRSRRHARVRV